jgi:predicted transcriptional regulator
MRKSLVRSTAALSFLVNKAVKEALQELAEADRRNLSGYLRVVLELHVEAKCKEGKPR